jgi:hypothetical protein
MGMSPGRILEGSILETVFDKVNYVWKIASFQGRNSTKKLKERPFELIHIDISEGEYQEK